MKAEVLLSPDRKALWLTPACVGQNPLEVVCPDLYGIFFQ